MAPSTSHAGVAADWAQLPAHLGRLLPGLAIEAQHELALGWRWSLRWQGQRFELDAHVHSPPAYERLIPSNFGGEPSREKIGDVLVELDSRPDLVWQFKNVILDLRVLATGRPEQTAGRARTLQLARAVQSFLERSVVRDLDAVTPRLEILAPAENTILLGAPLRLAYQAGNAAPEECHLEIRSDGFEHVTRGTSEITVTPGRVGRVRLWLCLRSTRSALRSPFAELAFQSVREVGRSPVRVQARYLEDARLEHGPGWRLRFDRDRRSSERAMVFFVALGDQSAVVMQFCGPRYSSAPPGIAMKLETALLLHGGRAPATLRAPELHIEQHSFPDIRGVISLAGQDWEIAAVSHSAPEGAWMDELRLLGVDVAGPSE